MRLKLLSRVLTVLGGLMAISMCVPGCVDEDSELYILGVLKPASGQCAVKAQPDADQVFVGTIDVAVASLGGGTDYSAALIFGNQLVARGSPDLIRAETNRVTIHSADVSIENADGAVIQSYSVPTSGHADPTVGGQPGFGVAVVPLIDGPTASKQVALASGRTHRLVSKVRLFGKTLGGSSVQTNEFSFVIYACSGCLISFPPELVDPSKATPNCGKAGDAMTASTAVIPCKIGQDDVVACSLCQGLKACRGAITCSTLGEPCSSATDCCQVSPTICNAAQKCAAGP